MLDATVKPRLRGVPFLLDGLRVLVPSLTVVEFEEFEDVLSLGPQPDETIKTFAARIFPAALAAIRRNYPDAELEDLRSMVELADVPELYLAVCGASGMKRVDPGEVLPV